MVDEGDTPPSAQAVSKVKLTLEEAEGMLLGPMPHPHIEFFDSSIRLVWTKPEANVLLVIASSAEHPSYLYHADVQNGSAANHGTVEATASNLAHWLRLIESPDSAAHR